MVDVKINNEAAIAACDAIVDLVDQGTTNAQGTLRIYSGTEPVDLAASLGSAVLLSEHNLTNPAFGDAVNASPGGRATSGVVADDTDANANGVASFCRVFDRDDNPVFQGDVGESGDGAFCTMNSTTVQAGNLVEVALLVMTMPET